MTLDEIHNLELEVSTPSILPGGPYDVIVASLALHVLVGHQKQDESLLKSKYSNIFSTILQSLKPGGMLIYGDHVGTWGLYSQARLLEEVGFEDVDIAWRQEAFFVAGGRKSALRMLTLPGDKRPSL